MTTPKFSIITPTYNRAYVLWKTILAIQHQACNDWELIIVDDGSTDDTKKLLAEFQDAQSVCGKGISSNDSAPMRQAGGK